MAKDKTTFRPQDVPDFEQATMVMKWHGSSVTLNLTHINYKRCPSQRLGSSPNGNDGGVPLANWIALAFKEEIETLTPFMERKYPRSHWENSTGILPAIRIGQKYWFTPGSYRALSAGDMSLGEDLTLKGLSFDGGIGKTSIENALQRLGYTLKYIKETKATTTYHLIPFDAADRSDRFLSANKDDFLSVPVGSELLFTQKWYHSVRLDEDDDSTPMVYKPYREQQVEVDALLFLSDPNKWLEQQLPESILQEVEGDKDKHLRFNYHPAYPDAKDPYRWEVILITDPFPRLSLHERRRVIMTVFLDQDNPTTGKKAESEQFKEDHKTFMKIVDQLHGSAIVTTKDNSPYRSVELLSNISTFSQLWPLIGITFGSEPVHTVLSWGHMLMNHALRDQPGGLNLEENRALFFDVVDAFYNDDHGVEIGHNIEQFKDNIRESVLQTDRYLNDVLVTVYQSVLSAWYGDFDVIDSEILYQQMQEEFPDTVYNHMSDQYRDMLTLHVANIAEKFIDEVFLLVQSLKTGEKE